MSYDVIIQAVGIIPSHLSGAKGKPVEGQEARSYYPGDVIGVYPVVSSHPNVKGRLVFIHVTGVPSDILIEDIKGQLLAPAISYESQAPSTILRRKFKIDETLIWNDSMAELVTTKKTISSWAFISKLYTDYTTGKTLSEALDG
jgi:hypothetical protein